MFYKEITLVLCTLLFAVFQVGTLSLEASPIKTRPTWDEIHEIVARMCEQIDNDNTEVLFGVSVGGLVPTTLFSLELSNKNVATISARSYDGQKQKALTLHNKPTVESIRGKSVLLIDDIVDSGVTIREVKRVLLEEYDAKEVKVASIYVKKGVEVYPDYWGEEVTEWIEFPWEIKKEASYTSN